MRENKFRARRVDDGRWAYGYYVHTPITTEFSCDGQFLDSVGNGRPCIIQNSCAHEIDPSTLGQYTGLRDKNGKEIYEGDILRGTGIDEKIRVWKAVSLHYFHHWQHTEDLIDEHGDIEVIGNIYQNPELLTNR